MPKSEENIATRTRSRTPAPPKPALSLYTHLDVYKRQVHNHQLGLKLDRWVIEHAIAMLRQRKAPITLFINCLLYTSRCV